MSNVRSSASTAVTSVFGVITTSMTTLDRSLTSLDCATGVMENKVKAWAHATNQATVARSKVDDIRITTMIQQEVAEMLKQHHAYAAKDDNEAWLTKARDLLTPAQ